ncbi:Ig-like domain-containing protein [Marinobacter sp. JSM 1782161]|uniref:Ig-like domain-containing protein n=1 Tax=Marinobacter sp. JSM 1782161 TaxID=2685906 RepID=UPI0014024AE1|nr:Ig-like domain-containing protein [Marinobacter sp. JSM 1782161]
MLRKTLISLAVASSVGLTGCLDDGSSDKNANPDYQISNPDRDGKTWPIFNPITSELPIPNDLIFDSDQGDGTFGVSDSSPPVTTALNELSGASTVAPAVIQLNGQVDPATVNAGTVFLLQLEYASGDPVQGLSNGEPPTVAGAANVRADVETLDGTSAIRILPLEPLEPRKRYIAVVTKDVKDLNGDSILASPSYENLTDETQPLGNSALAAVRTLINSLWEPSIEGALGLTDDQIALSYSFTTSNDEKVLQYIAEPGAWFADQVETFVKVSAASSAVEGGASSYSDVNTAVTGAVTLFPNIPTDDGSTIADKLATLFGSGAPCEGETGESAIDCAGVALASNFINVLPTPVTGVNRFPTDITLSATGTPVGLVSALAAQVTGSDGVLAAQGTVELPYYLGTTASTVATDSWQADSGIAAGLNSAFASIGLSLPQADSSVSTAVNYIFPFPEQTDTVDVPVLALYPASGTINGVVLYQHGITTDRSAALTFGTALAAGGYAVFAIDQPLHGVAAFTDAEQQALSDQLLTGAGLSVNDTNRSALLASQLSSGLLQQLIDAGCTGLSSDTDTAKLQVIGGACAGTSATAADDMAGLVSIENTAQNAGSTIPGLAPMVGNERHFGLYAAAPSTPAAIDYDAGVGDSGSLYINLTSFLTTRDNNRQSAVDQMNLRASIPGLELPDTDGSTLATIGAAPSVYFAGHSLGTITGTPFLASVNANQLDATLVDGSGATLVPSTFNDINAASLLTPGGGIVRLLENSPTFAPQILLGLQNSAGLAQGDADLETYFNVFQATVDTADPVNFVDNFAAPNTILLSQINGDTVIPNAADDAQWGIPALEGTFETEANGTTVNVTVDSFNAPLAGTQPLTLGLTNITTYDEGSHGTPVSADVPATFGQMVTETLTLFGSN